MNILQVQNVISALDDEIKDLIPEDLEYLYMFNEIDIFTVIGNGYECIRVTYFGITIWDSEDDEREYLDKESDIKEPLRDLIIRKIAEINKMISYINFNEKK